MNKLQWSYYSLHDKLHRAHDCAVDLKTASQKQSKLASENGFLIFYWTYIIFTHADQKSLADFWVKECFCINLEIQTTKRRCFY